MTLKQRLYYWSVLIGCNKGLFHEIEKELLSKYYNSSNLIQYRKNKTIIFMVDGRSIHGGLADRIRGMISLYAICKKNNWDYKINFSYPFSLINYLEPNDYDWTIKTNLINYNKKYSIPVLLNSYQLPTEFHEYYLKIKMFNKKELHIYSESPWGEKEFSALFNELFRPSQRLQADINTHLSKIGKEYISATFRFQQLLGDFKEGNYPTLQEYEKEKLISSCLSQLDILHQEYPNDKILVTADSITFLQRTINLNYIYTIPGNVVHMDYTNNATYNIYEKSFLDYFLIANAKKIHLIYNKQMYRSGFARQAAKIYNHPYIEIFLGD